FTCSDTKGNTYVTDESFQGAAGSPSSAICHAFVGTSVLTTDSIRVTIGGNPSGTCAYNVHGLEFRNIRATSSVDDSSHASGNSKAADSGSISLTDVDAVVGAVAWKDTGGISGNAGTGWTNFIEAVGTTVTGVTEYFVTSVNPQSASSADSTIKPW